jgi:hypothetical protein
MENIEIEHKLKNSDEQLLMRSAFFRDEMKKAFMHGRNFEQLETDGDMDVDNLDDKHLPFYDWFSKHYA